MTTAAWDALMLSLGLSENRNTYEEIRAAYSEPHRHYHTLRHIDSCLQCLTKVEEWASHPSEIAIALWFHDAIYDPYAIDNEARSADWAAAFLEKNAVPRDQINRVRTLIMSTLHNAPAATTDEALMIDIDLSILGSAPRVYNEFEDAVREEYKRVPEIIYLSKRKKILKGFLDRERIYQNQYLFDLLEKQARENLNNVLAS